jgi:hypothetical protein
MTVAISSIIMIKQNVNPNQDIICHPLGMVALLTVSKKNT